MSWTLRAAALVAGLVLSSLTRVSQAAPCGRPDIDVTFPPNDASRVPPNALFSAHYGSPALYDNEPVTVTDAAGNDVPVMVTFDDADAMLRAAPMTALDAGQHAIVWPGLRSVSGGGVGLGRNVGFAVGSVADAQAPTYAGLTDIQWDLARDRDPCLDKLDDRFVFTFDAGPASDDAGTDLLSLLVFQTRDPAAPDQTSPTQIAVRAWPSDGKVEVRRPANKAGETCFAAIVQDLRGNVSGGGDHQECITTKKPPFFDGCAIAAPGSDRQRDGAAWLLLLGLGLALFRRGPSARPHLPRAL